MSVSIQQAAANAFAGWLGQQLSDVKVEARWPAPDKQLPPKAITLVASGARRDSPIDPHLLSKTNQGATQTRAIWQVAACYQPFQLDVWATRDLDRDDIIARLDVLLYSGEKFLTGVFNPNPVGAGVLLAVQDGWQESGTTADFSFEGPDLMDDGNTGVRSIYRASYRGGANVMLAIPVVSARQKIIDFKLRLDSTDYESHLA